MNDQAERSAEIWKRASSTMRGSWRGQKGHAAYWVAGELVGVSSRVSERELLLLLLSLSVVLLDAERRLGGRVCCCCCCC